MKKLNDLLWTGDLKIYQDDNKFMFSIDSVLLAKFVTINKNCKKILDIGTGNAPIPLMLRKRTNAKIIGVEIQKESSLLAIESIKYNKFNNIEIINDDIKNVEFDINSFDTIVCNPPYFKDNTLISENECKSIARSELTLSLNDIFEISKKILKNNGNIAIVNRPERLVDIICLMKKYSVEPKKLQLIYPKENKDCNLILIEGTKNGRPGLKILDSIIMHNNNEYSDKIQNLLKYFPNE